MNTYGGAIAAGGPGQPSVGSYIQNRLDPQLAWYERKSATAKRSLWSLSAVQFSSTALIPLLNAVSAEAKEALYLSSAFAAVAAIATGLTALGRYNENWVRYRKCATSLESLKLKHQHGVAPFDGPDADIRLIELTEATIETEADQWATQMSKLKLK